MATKTAPRAAAPLLNWFNLPTLPHPQHISEEGYERTEPSAGDVEPTEQLDDAMDGVGDELEAEPKLEEAVEAIEVEEEGEPLLDIAESLIFAQSLRQSRQRHMQRLLPHIFTHPPLSSHSKPRARGPPRSTFLYPTPPGPTAPLPYREYHGPRGGKTGGDPASPGASSPKPTEDAKSSSTIRSQIRAKRAADLDEIAPAHETECIARVTLTVGAFSYPETEVWIGRFVEPRPDAAKVNKADKRARVLAGEVEPPKKRVVPPVPKPSAAPAGLGGAARPVNQVPRPMPQVRPGAIAPTSGATAGSSTGPGTAAPRPALTPEAAINPDLIKKVNSAAATRPWLSDIIHKAARKQASKEELARLGRAVGRLNRGEDVDDGESAVAGPSGTVPVAASAVPARLTANADTTRSESPLTDEDEDDSDLSDLGGEMNGKGPPQVGGGGPPYGQPGSGDSAGSLGGIRPGAVFNAGQISAGPPTSPRVPMTYPQLPPSTATPYPRQARPPPPPPISGFNPIPHNPFPRPPPLTSYVTPTSSSIPPSFAPQPATAMPPPPPPRPIYPRIPPFLFIAFKDAPTEKFLIPLGANSFISRAGGDHVTHPAPVAKAPPHPPPTPPLPSPQPVAAPVPPTPAAIPTPVPIEVPAIAAGKGRTRQSLGRGAKEAPTPPLTKEDPAAPPPDPPVPAPAEEPAPVVPPPPARIVEPPKPGTVILSTLMPTLEWEEPDWRELEKALPWNTPVPPRPPPVSAYPGGPGSSAPVTSVPGGMYPHDPTPGRPPAGLPSHPAPSLVQSLPRPVLNLGAVDLTPAEGDLQPMTIRLSGMDDHAWSRMKQIVDIVEMAELEVLGRKEPELLVVPEVTGLPAANSAPPHTSQLPPSSQPPHPLALQQVRETYLTRKKARFARLLGRVPSRSFLRLRTERADPALAEALSDKWAPRPYTITTKSLYTRSPPPDDGPELAYANPYSPEKPAKKRKSNANEPAVAFEMPVSLDALDERVEEGAKFAVGRRRGRPSGDKAPRKSGAGRPPMSRASVGGENGEEGSKKLGSRSKAGAICEGCASTSVKVWRKGPGGKGTLCKDCGDAYNAGTLGPLAAPGAMTGVKAEPSAEPPTADSPFPAEPTSMSHSMSHPHPRPSSMTGSDAPAPPHFDSSSHIIATPATASGQVAAQLSAAREDQMYTS